MLSKHNGMVVRLKWYTVNLLESLRDKGSRENFGVGSKTWQAYLVQIPDRLENEKKQDILDLRKMYNDAYKARVSEYIDGNPKDKKLYEYVQASKQQKVQIPAFVCFFHRVLRKLLATEPFMKGKYLAPDFDQAGFVDDHITLTLTELFQELFNGRNSRECSTVLSEHAPPSELRKHVSEHALSEALDKSLNESLNEQDDEQKIRDEQDRLLNELAQSSVRSAPEADTAATTVPPSDFNEIVVSDPVLTQAKNNGEGRTIVIPMDSTKVSNAPGLQDL